jgi:hypothetical protein
MTRSLCDTCSWMRLVKTPKGSCFLLCQLSRTNPAYPKYPPQPVVACQGYETRIEEPTRPDADLGMPEQ